MPFTLLWYAGTMPGVLKAAAASVLCSTTVRVSGKSRNLKCDQQYIGATKTVQVYIVSTKPNSCAGVKIMAKAQLRSSLPFAQTGCLIDT